MNLKIKIYMKNQNLENELILIKNGGQEQLASSASKELAIKFFYCAKGYSIESVNDSIQVLKVLLDKITIPELIP